MRHCLGHYGIWERCKVLLFIYLFIELTFRRLHWVYHCSEVRGQLNNEIWVLPTASLQRPLRHLSNFYIVNKCVVRELGLDILCACACVCLFICVCFVPLVCARVSVCCDTIIWSDGSVVCEEVNCLMWSGPLHVLLWESSCLNMLYKWNTWLWALFMGVH